MFLLIAMLISNVALAAPLTDFSLGKTAIDVTLYPSMNTSLTNNYGYDQSPNTDGIFELGATVGLGKGLALQYNQFNPETKWFNGDWEKVRLNSYEFNVLKQIATCDRSFVAAFIGINRVGITDSLTGAPDTYSDNKNVFQYGLVASQKIGPKNTKVSLFGKAGFGQDLANIEVGAAYALSKNLDINVNYRVLNVKNISFGAYTLVNSEFKGLGIGLTGKF